MLLPILLMLGKDLEFLRSLEYPAFSGWINDTLFWHWQNPCIVVYDIRDAFPVDTIWCGSRQLRPYKVTDRYVLLTENKKRIFRHSFMATWWIYLVDKDTLMLAAPDSTRNLQILFWKDTPYAVYSRHNNLFLSNLITKKIVRLTNNSPELDTTLAGIPDWVYEEEFSLVEDALTAHERNHVIVWYEFRQAHVPEVIIPLLSAEGYPLYWKIRYPRAGQHPAIVRIGVYDLETGRLKYCPIYGDSLTYVPLVRPVKDSRYVSILTLNRRQNHLKLWLWDPLTDSVWLFLEEKDTAFIELRRDWLWLSEDSLLWISDREGVFRLYLCTSDSCHALTPFNMEVRRLAGFSGKYGIAWVEASYLDKPYQILAFKVNIYNGTILPVLPKYYKRYSMSLNVSPDGTFAVVERSAFTSPPSWEVVNVLDTFGSLYTLAENHYAEYVLKALMKKRRVPQAELIQYFSPVDSCVLYAWVITPPAGSVFRRIKNVIFKPRYPLFVHVYGGPHSQLVVNRWNYYYVMYSKYALDGYVVAFADGHGTNGRGKHFRHAVYRRLGMLEVEDQRGLVKYLLKLKKIHIDKHKVVIYGWSYGGYVAGLCKLRYPDIFRYAIAGAPVTTWLLYDNIYTERYMDLPDSNEYGYKVSAWHTYVDNLTSGRLMIIHGLGDDNVHVQHTLSFIKLAIAKGKGKFIEWNLYPDERHGLTGSARSDLHNRIREFLKKHLGR